MDKQEGEKKSQTGPQRSRRVDVYVSQKDHLSGVRGSVFREEGSDGD